MCIIMCVRMYVGVFICVYVCVYYVYVCACIDMHTHTEVFIRFAVCTVSLDFSFFLTFL